MINQKQARKYCGEDISLIENYEQAKKDLIQTLDIHHRKEDDGYSRQDLKDNGLYYNRPANELIFLTSKEHRSLHMKGKKHTEEARQKMSDAKKGVHLSEETKRKMSDAKKGVHLSEETRIKIGEANSKPVQQIEKQTGKVIRTWPCLAEVKRVLGISQGNISRCCFGQRKSTGGFIWRYADK